MEKELLQMSRRERDVLKVMSLVLSGQRTQAEAARLLKRSVRQVRRMQRRLERDGDGGIIHRLRGRPSNRAVEPSIRQRALDLYRRHYHDFGPTLACEKLVQEHQLDLRRETLRRWLLGEGLWQEKRQRDAHRSRRERKACFGEMVQADGSEHDWLEGRGQRMVLLAMIDDATGRIMARFYEAETTEAYMDLLGRYIRRHGRPASWYSDRDSVFRAESKQDRERSVPTQFSRALAELDVELILANSPQAKGRVERLFGTLQDRWVKELRLAKVNSMQQANDLLESKLLAQFNARFAVKAASPNDAHRKLDARQDLAAILSVQEKRTVSNDYTIRLDNCFYQLLAPVWPGERGGLVTVENRLDGSMKIRFKQRYLEYRKIDQQGLAAPDGEDLSLAPKPIPAERGAKAKDRATAVTRSSAVRRTAGRSGRTPALPYPSGSKSCGRSKDAWRPAPHHPWREAG
jgi:ribosomal protein L29